MRLLLDLGNTRLKWTLAEGARLHGEVVALPWDTPDFAARLRTLLTVLPRVDAVWLAAVAAPEREAQVRDLLRESVGVAAHSAHADAEVCGVRLAYREPARMGIDRVLGLVAAHAAGHAPCVLAGIGTALTLDALAADGRHLGGLIVAAPQLMQRALRAAAGRVQSASDAGQVCWFADNTEDALAAGAWLAAAALVDRFHAQTAQTLGAVPVLLLSGGAAPRLRALLRTAAQPLPDAVLRGLALYAEHAGAAPDAASCDTLRDECPD